MSPTPPATGSAVRSRFAPSPTGSLQVGNARTALFNWLLARHEGGQMLLRIEDTDLERSQAELIDQTYRTLEWLGLDWDGEVVVQSTRAAEHAAAAQRLVDGGHAYYCDCSQAEVQARAKARGGKPGYDSHCRDRGLQPGGDRPMVVRFRVPDDGETVVHDVIRGDVSFPNADLEDFVVVRSNGTPMFLLSNAVDDADAGVTHILRGEDLLNVTPKTLLLRDALGYGTDGLVFGHLPLIVDAQRKKLSKRHGAVPVEDYRARGYLADALVNYMTTLGWGAPDGIEVRPRAEIIELFELDQVSKASAMFDQKKLDSFNGEYLRALPVATFIDLSEPFFAGVPWAGAGFDPRPFEAMAPLVQERVKTLAEAPEMVDFLYLDEPVIDQKSWDKTMVNGADLARTMLDVAVDRMGSVEPWAAQPINDAIIGYADEHEISRAKAQAPVRVAITGRTVGPPLWDAMEVLGREICLQRLQQARARVG
jgi:glutamyl-tRNA synthetase